MMENKPHYDTVSQATTDLLKRGYNTDFEVLLEENCLKCNTTNKQLPPEDFAIDEIHRFEGNTDPGDEMIVYAISSDNLNMKGIVINAFGMYADAGISKIVSRLKRR